MLYKLTYTAIARVVVSVHLSAFISATSLRANDESFAGIISVIPSLHEYTLPLTGPVNGSVSSVGILPNLNSA